MTELTIKNFTVLDTDSGKMPITGRLTSTQVNNILSCSTILNGIVERTRVPGTPTEISSGSLSGNAHMSTSYVKIINDFNINPSNDSVCCKDNFIRITYLGGTTSASNSLLYGFTSSITSELTSITWNVLIAKNTSQTLGDYFDVEFPDMTYYPPNNFYIVFILINAAWDSRTIVSGNICSITNTGYNNFCIDPSKSQTDVNKSNFICCQGVNSFDGICTRVVVACEDWIASETDYDYNDLIFFVGSRVISDAMINDTSTS
jgi:hypothetical protein